ncbi:Tyrosyl-tRNA synthetase (EC 6.1.1.1) [uncultured Gammaproteobacteria bacterium]|jgi:tyrosyl-tRNA synthetase|uniref:Tyrosine--tRNA ligase n=3 Tax=sulfur-oxidizing symbionts TaxID=32036 RepID=A0A1H6KSK6_9GAMM|nr:MULTISPECIES: tyrosine--tRNA ligase [sulfur-oxidizing symbionts]CAC5815794.1 Tyrosyl-tRNA synthetase (EC 6.1.1.1) [uncultured Gammaproteobacteria bacterium]CAB5505410.1 Tyrosyl-tRNA synthetase (EC [Bathymodiolus azoricus thioautotrophic gill symbiont]CAB5508268.1 Tyrosyl-tRNA synthetase (EC [Bathymodiolus thermophilus thioautotrophic gill symbiont]CAC9495247.1 Tyrosyl-tRNA synthetase (EC 6.1.1.1) [uncultured Gammaproteobacteria bacterium]CAC9506318.1 Tyrosyl-tRNA synthetase (EC 6.1.1.1) [un
MNIEQTLAIFQRGSNEILPLDELRDKLKRKKILKIKAGFDPTAPDLHLGHTVLINKLKQLQDLGHEIQFLIGDFTAMIGDPTGKSKTRPPLSREQVQENAKSYTQQVFKILDKNKTNIVFNSQWIDKLTPIEFVKLASMRTVARMLERNDFEARHKNGDDIAIHEFLYPLAQGYDSVVLESDIEVGGTDQKFNLLMGRELQKRYGKEQQVILTMPILEGLDGVQKMSKSLNNYIAIDDNPDDMFGKIMSISDKLMWRYFELLSFESLETIANLKQEMTQGKNPRDIKFILADEIITRFHNAESAKQAQQNFIDRFSKNQIPNEMEEFNFNVGVKIANLLKDAGLCPSTSNAYQMIKQGAAKINGEKITNKNLEPEIGTEVYQVGKRKFARVTIK